MMLKNLVVLSLYLLGHACINAEVLQDPPKLEDPQNVNIIDIQQDDVLGGPNAESSKKVVGNEPESHSSVVNDDALPLETPDVIYEETDQSNEKPDKENNENKDENDEQDNDGYKKGSVCVYCKYCKLCKLCDKKCPCEKDSKLEHCKMCKYCDHCYLCDVVCKSVCTPGGFMDMFSSAVYDAIPSFSEETKKDVESDIKKARSFIKEYL